jgi:hypothetical protein
MKAIDAGPMAPADIRKATGGWNEAVQGAGWNIPGLNMAEVLASELVETSGMLNSCAAKLPSPRAPFLTARRIGLLADPDQCP